MRIEDPEPLTENVIDLDFCFLGNVQTNISLLPDKGDRFVAVVDGWVIQKGIETIIVLRRNVLYFAQRSRQRPLPVTKLEPVNKPPLAFVRTTNQGIP